jgi:hypothetical protein
MSSKGLALLCRSGFLVEVCFPSPW